MNNKWAPWLYPLGCLAIIIFLLIFVFCASGCSCHPDNTDDSTASATTVHASTPDSVATSSNTPKSILVCSHLGTDNRGDHINFADYAAVIWVEPVTKNVFSVYYSAVGEASPAECRAISGPLQDVRWADGGGFPIFFDNYSQRAQSQGYTLVYE